MNDTHPTRTGRIGYVASRVRQATGLPYFVEIVAEIGGSDIQGAAISDRDVVRVTETAIDILDDDELAWLIAHEFAHLSLRHSALLTQKTDELYDAMFEAVKESHQQRKRLGHSFLRRSISSGIRGLAGVAAVGMAALSYSRKHETEADEWATRATLAAGFNPSAGASLLRKLYRGAPPALALTELLVSTHPDPQNRVERVALYAETVVHLS